MLVKLYNLSYRCPKAEIREKDCPFLAIEHLFFSEKIAWIDLLEDERKESILRHHFFCTKSKKNSNQY